MLHLWQYIDIKRPPTIALVGLAHFPRPGVIKIPPETDAAGDRRKFLRSAGTLGVGLP
jgi:hypothetical protein